MQYLTVLTLLLTCASSWADYLSKLKMPPGVKRPTVHQHMNYQAPVDLDSTAIHVNSVLLEPPRSIIAKSKKKLTTQYSVLIATHKKLSNTPHMAVLLKNKGYRLYKKRTIQNDSQWMYWLKSLDGTPLFRVELVWKDLDRQSAELHLWSWDDKTQIPLESRQSLITVFGSVLPE